MYYITSSSHNFWRPCNAKTLTGAKRIATSMFSGGYNHDTISVAHNYQDVDGADKVKYRYDFLTLSTKSNYPESRWVDEYPAQTIAHMRR